MKPELKEWDAAVTDYLTAAPNDPRADELLKRVIAADRKAREAGILVPLAVPK
jgi:hypothetical protein